MQSDWNRDSLDSGCSSREEEDFALPTSCKSNMKFVPRMAKRNLIDHPRLFRWMVHTIVGVANLSA